MSAPETRSWTELCDLLGEPAARRLVELHGGEKVTIPRRCNPDHPLSAGLGIETYRTLVSMWGGCRVYVPVVIRRQHTRCRNPPPPRARARQSSRLPAPWGCRSAHVRGRIRKT